MKMFMRILLLVVILALGISGGGIQPAQAQSPAKPKTVQVDGELHLLLYWIDYQSISQGPASESNNYVYNLDIEGKFRMSTSADNVGDNTVVFVPTFTTFYQFHVFHFDASSVHCSGMGYLDGEAQLGKMSVPDLLNPNHDEYVTPFDFKKSIPQQYRGNKSGSMPQCPNPASEQVINEYVKNITGKFPSGALIHLQVTNRSDTYMGGPAYLGNWDLKMPTQASGLVERKNSGQWYVRLTDATTSPQKSGWRNRGGK